MQPDKLLEGMKTAQRLGDKRGLLTVGFSIHGDAVEGIYVSPPRAEDIAQEWTQEPLRKPRRGKRGLGAQGNLL